jgi:hypothetical protein
MRDLLLKRHSQARLRMHFHNISQLGRPIATPHFLPKISDEASQGHLRSKMSDGVSESRASSLVKGFEKPAPAWLAQA